MTPALRYVPANARSRPVALTGRLLNCQLGSDDNQGNTTETLRLQRLRLLGILGQRAAVIASLAWGDTA